MKQNKIPAIVKPIKNISYPKIANQDLRCLLFEIQKQKHKIPLK